MIFFLLAAAASANCDKAVTQWELHDCAVKQFIAADAEMNRQWPITVARMKEYDQDIKERPDGRPGYFDTLLKAQRAWLAFREAHCANEGFYARGGSMESMLISMCRTQLTKERTEQLSALIEVH